MLYKDNLHKFFNDREPELWNFHPNVIFERFNAFLNRLETIRWFFNTVLEFTRLEKVEIGGMKGRVLSGRVTSVYNEFQQHFSVFSMKSYDVLDPDDPSFIADFETFKRRIFEMDLKLAAILCQAFDDCANLESVFKVGIQLKLFVCMSKLFYLCLADKYSVMYIGPTIGERRIY